MAHNRKALPAQGSSHRGAEIRTRDLTDPNGARYQAAPRPGGGDYRTGGAPRRPVAWAASRRAQKASNAIIRRSQRPCASTSIS